MDTVKNLRFEVSLNGNTRMVAIRFDREDSTEGLRYMWFVLTEKELEDLVVHGGGTYTDCRHNLQAMGDSWLFYDLDFPLRGAGVIQVGYVRLNVPQFVQKMVLRVCKRIWKGLGENPDQYSRPRVEFSFTREQVEKYLRLYGQGKGDVRVDMNERTAEFLSEVSSENFNQMYERVKIIARNSTKGFHETAVVYLSKDWDGFYWIAKNPHGRTIMNGGIINHGKQEGKADWSIHT